MNAIVKCFMMFEIQLTGTWAFAFVVSNQDDRWCYCLVGDDITFTLKSLKKIVLSVVAFHC